MHVSICTYTCFKTQKLISCRSNLVPCHRPATLSSDSWGLTKCCAGCRCCLNVGTDAPSGFVLPSTWGLRAPQRCGWTMMDLYVADMSCIGSVSLCIFVQLHIDWWHGPAEGFAGAGHLQRLGSCFCRFVPRWAAPLMPCSLLYAFVM